MVKRTTTAREAIAPEEFGRLVAVLERPLGRFVAQMIPNGAQAEDVVQETFCVGWKNRDRLPVEDDGQRAWMFAIARNEALRALRKQRRGQRAVERLAVDASQVDAMTAEALGWRDLVVSTLPPSDRSLFLLRYVHGFSAAELAQITGLRAATVRKRLERAATALRTAIADPSPAEKELDHARTSVI